MPNRSELGNPWLQIGHRWLAGFIGILTGLAIALTILLTQVSQILSNPIRFTQLVENSNLADNSRLLVSDLIMVYGLGNNTPTSANILFRSTDQGSENPSVSLIPADWYNQQVDQVLTQFLLWLDTPSQTLPDVELQLGPIRSLLLQPQGAQAILPTLQQYPPCQHPMLLPEGALLNCIPARSNLIELAGFQARSLSAALPESITITLLRSTGWVDRSTEVSLDQIRRLYLSTGPLVEFSAMVAFFLLCAYGCLHAKMASSLLKAMPGPLYLAGALVGIFYLALHFFPVQLLENILRNSLFGIRPDVVILLRDFILASTSMLKTNLPILGVGFIVLAIVFQYSYKKLTDAQKQKTLADTIRKTRLRKQLR